MRASGWYGRPVAALCATASMLALSAMLLAGAEFGPREAASKAFYAVTIRHFGVDAREMERSVAIPLEDAFAAAAGAIETSSTCEYGLARVLVHFADGTDRDLAYESVRDAAQRVYEGLPASAQRPEIATSSEGSGPVWVAAVYSMKANVTSIGHLLERTVRPALERLTGAGEVDIAGTGLPEIMVDVDEAAASVAGLGTADIAVSLAADDRFEPAGSLLYRDTELSIALDSRYEGLPSLRRASIATDQGTSIGLESLARLEERDRPPDMVSRVDAQKAVTVAVSPGGQANLPSLSRGIASATAELAEDHELKFQVLYDAGAAASASFNAILGAMLQGAIGVAIATALLLGGLPRGTVGAGRAGTRTVAVLAVPMMLVMSAAVLVACGFSLDRHIVAGLAVGLGASVDAAIIVAERLGAATCIAEGRLRMRGLVTTLLAGTATTVVVLVPLARLDFIAEGVARIAAAIAAVNGVSLLAAWCLLPPLMLAGRHATRPEPLAAIRPSCRLHGPSIGTHVLRCVRRCIAVDAQLCAASPVIPAACAAVLGLAGVLAILMTPLAATGGETGSTIEAHIDFESGTAVEHVDEGLAAWSGVLSGTTGVLCTYTTARRGYGSALVTYDPAIMERAQLCDTMRHGAPAGAFVWIPEPDAHERSFEVIVSGDDDAECRTLATSAASRLSALPWVIEPILQFKEGAPDIVIEPDRQRLAMAGVSFARVEDCLRRAIQGPVAYKRLDEQGQTDVRFMSRAAATVRGLGAIPVRTSTAPQPVAALAMVSRQRDVARIYRSDRRRIAALALRTRPIDPRSARDAVYAALAAVPHPVGYAFEFDRAAIESVERLSGCLGSFLVAALLAYIVTAAVSESLTVPLAVMLALPPSLAVPAILLVIAEVPVDASIACAFVAVSGIVVNASVLTVDAARRRGIAAGRTVDAVDLYHIIRSRFATLAATSGTTVAGALPFLLLGSTGAGMARALAFVTVLGSATSFIAATTLVPSLAVMFPGWFAMSGLSSIHQRKGD